MDVIIDAQLVVTSFALLGFNTDEYHEQYPGMSMELPPLTMRSFDKESETLLLCSLHFLLIRLDYDEFSYSIENCWPYLTNKAKTELKTAIYACFGRLQSRKQAVIFSSVSQAFWSANLNVRGHEVWILLRILSDLALDVAITTLSADDRMHRWCNKIGMKTDLSIEPPKRRISLGATSLDSLKSPSRFEYTHRDAGVNLTKFKYLETMSTRTEMIEVIERQQSEVEQLLAIKIASHDRQVKYMEELDERWRVSRHALDHLRKNRKGTKSNTNFALTDAGRRFRIGKLEKLSESLKLLRALAQSDLLLDAERCVKAFKEKKVDPYDMKIFRFTLQNATAPVKGDSSSMGGEAVARAQATAEVFAQMAAGDYASLPQWVADQVHIKGAIERTQNLLDIISATMDDEYEEEGEGGRDGQKEEEEEEEEEEEVHAYGEGVDVDGEEVPTEQVPDEVASNEYPNHDKEEVQHGGATAAETAVEEEEVQSRAHDPLDDFLSPNEHQKSFEHTNHHNGGTEDEEIEARE